MGFIANKNDTFHLHPVILSCISESLTDLSARLGHKYPAVIPSLLLYQSITYLHEAISQLQKKNIQSSNAMLLSNHTHTFFIFCLIFTLIRAHTILPGFEEAFSAHSFGLPVFKLVLFSPW